MTPQTVRQPQFDPDLAAGTIQSAEDFEAPVDAWSLDELEQLADLESVRHARGRRDHLDA